SSRVTEAVFARKHPAHCEPLPNGRYRSIFHSVVCCAVRRAARRNGNMARTNPGRAELCDRAEFQLVAVRPEGHLERSEGPPKRAISLSMTTGTDEGLLRLYDDQPKQSRAF